MNALSGLKGGDESTLTCAWRRGHYASIPLVMTANRMQLSGKLVIIGIVGVALAGAGAGWWFRYNATHRAAEFWGPQAVRLIRDAHRK